MRATVPMVRHGKVTGYMSIRTKATAEEIATVEPLYKASECRTLYQTGSIKGWWCVRLVRKTTGNAAALAGTRRDGGALWRARRHAGGNLSRLVSLAQQR